MKKIIAILLTLMISVNLVSSVSYAQGISTNKNSIYIDGMKLSSDDFRSVFSGEPETRKRLSTSRTVQDLTVHMNNVIV